MANFAGILGQKYFAKTKEKTIKCKDTRTLYETTLKGLLSPHFLLKYKNKKVAELAFYIVRFCNAGFVSVGPLLNWLGPADHNRSLQSAAAPRYASAAYALQTYLKLSPFQFAMATFNGLMEGVPWRRQEATPRLIVNSPLTLAAVLGFAIVSFQLLPLLLPPWVQDGEILGSLIPSPFLLERPELQNHRLCGLTTGGQVRGGVDYIY